MTLRAVVAMSLQVGFSTAICATLSIMGGLWLDQRFNSSPLFILVGAVLGLASSLYIVWQIVKPLQRMK